MPALKPPILFTTSCIAAFANLVFLSTIQAQPLQGPVVDERIDDEAQAADFLEGTMEFAVATHGTGDTYLITRFVPASEGEARPPRIQTGGLRALDDGGAPAGKSHERAVFVPVQSRISFEQVAGKTVDELELSRTQLERALRSPVGVILVPRSRKLHDAVRRAVHPETVVLYGSWEGLPDSAMTDNLEVLKAGSHSDPVIKGPPRIGFLTVRPDGTFEVRHVAIGVVASQDFSADDFPYQVQKAVRGELLNLSGDAQTYFFIEELDGLEIDERFAKLMTSKAILMRLRESGMDPYRPQ